MSALLLARGFVGPAGSIFMVDTEAGRGALYADIIQGGYRHTDLGSPFSPERHVEAIAAAEDQGADIIVLDGGSQEWEGEGGVVDQAGQIEERTGKSGLHCWNKPKAGHKKFMLKLLGSKVPVIICLRAKYKSRYGKDKKIVKDEFTTPIQSDDFIFEMTAHFETLKTKLETGEDHHYIRLTKCSHPDLVPCFPTKDPITTGTGEAIKAWTQAGEKAPAPQEPAKNGLTIDDAKAEAGKGEQHLREWWRNLSQADRKPLGESLEALMGIAKAADIKKADPAAQAPQDDAPPPADEYPDDIPFDD